MFLLDHHKTAHEQVVLAEKGALGGMPDVADINHFTLGVFANFLKNVRDAGASSKELQDLKAVLATIRDDQGMGPYTIKAITGGDGRPITDVGVLVIPRQYSNIVTLLISGLYHHEIGHNLFTALKLPDGKRDQILLDKVISPALKKCHCFC